MEESCSHHHSRSRKSKKNKKNKSKYRSASSSESEDKDKQKKSKHKSLSTSPATESEQEYVNNKKKKSKKKHRRKSKSVSCQFVTHNLMFVLNFLMPLINLLTKRLKINFRICWLNGLSAYALTNHMNITFSTTACQSTKKIKNSCFINNFFCQSSPSDRNRSGEISESELEKQRALLLAELKDESDQRMDT